MLKPDSKRYSPSVETRISGPEWTESGSFEPTEESSDVPAFHGREDLPTDLSLDLRLHEILQQARLTTAASGALIALARGDKMVCRATLGDMAPAVGACLNTRSGLSGACILTREMQLCDDSLADPRVNANSCRESGIRSIAVLPVLDGRELWGILEVFSSVPRAFSDFDLQALQSLGRKITRMVHEAIESGSETLVPETFSEPMARDSVTEEIANYETPLEPVQSEIPVVRRDYRTGALTAAVLALAVLLGWMVGRVGWSMAVNRSPAQIPIAAEEMQPRAQVIPDTQPDSTHHDAQPAPGRPAESKSALPPSARPASKPKPAAPVELNGGLVVFEHGKVVFRTPPSEKESPTKAQPGVVESGSIQQAATRADDSSAAPAPVSSPSANSYLLERVDPEYPEAARQQRIQGPVVLNVLVGNDGSVREVKVVSGDPQLVKAATDAVRQWRFQPHQLKGHAVEFETRITVNFALP